MIVDSRVRPDLEQFRKLINQLEEIIPVFIETISDEEKTNAIKDCAIKIGDIYRRLKEIDKDDKAIVSLASIFKCAEDEQLIFSELYNCYNLLDYDMHTSRLKMSETYLIKLEAMVAMYKKTFVKLQIVYPSMTLDESDIDEALSLLEKHPRSFNLFRRICTFRDDERVQLKMDILKQNAMRGGCEHTIPNIIDVDEELLSSCTTAPKPLPREHNIASNMITRTYHTKSEPLLTLSDIIMKHLNLKIKNLSDLVILSKKNPILVLIRPSDIRYESYKLNNYDQGRGSITKEMIDATYTTCRIKPARNSGIYLYNDGKVIDVIKQRRFAPLETHQETAKKIKLAIQTNDEELWSLVDATTIQLSRILSGPNLIISELNRQSEYKISQHFRGKREIESNVVIKSMANIRHAVVVATIKNVRVYMKQNKLTIDSIDKYFARDETYDIFAEVLHKDFYEYIKSNKISQIVARETVLSYLNDLHFKTVQYRRDLLREFNIKGSYSKKLNTKEELITPRNQLINLIARSNTEQVYLFLEQILSNVLINIIHDTNNIYNMLENKRLLFS